jgi:Coenzyme PQQ synthesis protein D (PqqD)
MITSERIRSTRLKDLMINGNGFAFDPRSGFTYNLSSTGMEVVGWLKDGVVGEEIVERLVDKYGIDHVTAREDLQSFLTALGNYALIDSPEKRMKAEG